MSRDGNLYLRQLQAGRDFSAGDPVATQMANYAYAVGDRSSGEAVLVDPAYAPGELVSALEADGMRLAGVVLTHYHADHAGGALFGYEIAGVKALLERVNVPVHVQRAELPWVAETTGLGAGELDAHDPGAVLRVGTIEIELLHTPGHTPGSQCVLVDGRLLTGDTLFLQGCGRTDLPGGDAEELYESLAQRLAPLPDSTLVLPGHAYSPEPSAGLGALRRTNPVLLPTTPELWRARFS